MIDWITGNARTVDERTVATAGADPAVVGGRYELGALLGTGASAVVRRGLDRVSGRTFAVKLFHAGASAHDRRRQQREMRALATLHHPGLVALYDGGVEDGRPFIVTDLVEGPTLAERLDAGPLDPEELLGIGARLADALAHVHRAGIVHRDLKPANVLLGADGPRLADFGIARALDGTAVTGTGYVVGTAAYLAPEQVRGEWVGPEADVYALGLVLLESLTGRREYPGALVESATARLHRPPGIPTGLPFALDTALRAMTALDPADRPTAADVATMLAADRRAGAAGGRVRTVVRGRCPPDRGGGDDPGGRGGGDGGRPAARGARGAVGDRRTTWSVPRPARWRRSRRLPRRGNRRRPASRCTAWRRRWGRAPRPRGCRRRRSRRRCRSSRRRPRSSARSARSTRASRHVRQAEWWVRPPVESSLSIRHCRIVTFAPQNGPARADRLCG